MARKPRVLWAKVAERDLLKIVTYIADQSHQKALAILNKIKKETAKLQTYPNRGRIVPELERQGLMLYRELIIPPWRVFYRPTKERILIFAIIDSRRNIEDILLQRLLNID